LTVDRNLLTGRGLLLWRQRTGGGQRGTEMQTMNGKRNLQTSRLAAGRGSPRLTVHGQRSTETAGITLIEMLVVITIIALFSAIAYQRLAPALDQGRVAAAKTQIESLGAALQRYNIEHGRFPDEDEGLAALRPFLQKDIPNDPWQNPYVYKFPGEHGPEPDVLCYGSDGQPGGEETAADIVSWR